MPAGTPLAAAFVRIRPDVSGFRSEAEREMQRAGSQAGSSFADRFGDAARRSGASESAGDDAGRQFGGAFADSVKVAAGVAIAKIGELAAQQLSNGFNQALDLSGAQGLFQAQLGVSAQEAGKIGAVAGKLFSNAYGENMEEVNTAITSVVQNMDGMKGASSGALEDITARALTTSKVLGEDVGGVTRAVSQLMRTGLAPNAQAAFDLINKGAQNGINVAGDLLDTVSEYSTQFREVGLSGPRAFGLIQQALKAGARDADTAADAIKEFAIRSKTASDPNTIKGFEALNLNVQKTTRTFALGGPAADKMFNTVITRLKGIKDPVKQNEIAVALFGTKAEDLGKALFALNPAKAEQSLGKLAGTTDRASKAMGETAQARFETFKRTLQTSVVNFVANEVIPALEKFNGFLNSMGTSGAGLAAVAVPIAGIGIGAKIAAGAVSGLSTAVGGIKSAAGAVSSTAQAAGRMAQGFRSAQVAESAFSGRAGTFGGKLRTAYNAAATGARSFATAALNGARASLTAARAATSAALAHARAGAAAALSAARTLAAAAAQRVIAIATRAWAIVQTALNFVLSANPIGLVVLAIGALIAALVLAYKNSATFRTIVQAAFSGIAAAGKFMWEKVLQPVFKAIGFFVTKILIPYYKMWWNIAKAVFSGIASAGSAMWGFLRPIFTAIKNFIVGQLMVQFRAFRTVVGVVWSGIKSASSGAWSVLSGIFNRLKQAIGLVGTAFGRGATAIRSAWDKIKGYTKSPVNFVIGTVYNKGIVGLWNKVMGWLHLPESLRLGTIPQLASGGPLTAAMAGKRNKPTAIVGEGDPNHPEYVIPTDPKYRGRAMSLWQAAGSKMQFMKSGGILGGIEKLAGKVKNIAGAGLDLITNPSKVWDRLVKSLPSWEHLKSGPFGKAIAAIPPKILAQARTYAINFFKAFSSGYGGSNGDVVKAALKYIGVGDDRGVDNNNMFTRHYGWPSGTPWCALFASKAIEDARAQKRYPGTPTASVATFNSRMRHVPVGSGRPGDLATYGSDDHVNLIIKKVAGGYDTVGGNQGPRVNRYVRGGQATVLRPMASGGALSAHIKEVFRQENLDRRDRMNPVLNGYRGMRKPLFDDGGFGSGWPFHKRKPEPVFNPQQWGLLQELVARGSEQGPLIGGDVHLHDGVDIDALSQRLEFQRKARSF